MKYKSDRIIDGKRRKVIVEDEKIINRNPNKEELNDLEYEPYARRSKGRMSELSDNDILRYLNQFYRENGRIPGKLDFNNDPKYPSFVAYQKRFGSWNKAIEMAGLQTNRVTNATDDELLGYLSWFYEDNGRPPTARDFIYNTKYPGFTIYQKRFGSWNKALKLVGLDVDTMIIKGVLPNEYHKGRLFEIYVIKHFTEESVDVSGENRGSSFDGICPKGQTYDAKSVGLKIYYWMFNLTNVYREKIKWFYLGAFDKDYKKLLHVWRIPGNFVDEDYLVIGVSSNYICNIENMKEYDITEKFKDINIFK